MGLLSTQVVLLGTGTPNAEPDQAGSAIAVISNDTPYLVDFGPGVVRQIQRAHQQGIEDLSLDKIEHVFCTHLHSDHTAGYPDLLLTPWVLERERPLKVYGPPGIKEMTSLVLLAYSADIYERQNGLESANVAGLNPLTHEIEEGVFYEDDNVKVEAIAVRHGGMSAFGYKFTTTDKVIVISGDTCPNEKLLDVAVGCDILIHEVYSAKRLETRPSKWQAYHSAVHTSTTELAQIASITQPKLLVLTHQLAWGASDEELLSEVTEGYDGAVAFGQDLDVY